MVAEHEERRGRTDVMRRVRRAAPWPGLTVLAAVVVSSLAAFAGLGAGAALVAFLVLAVGGMLIGRAARSPVERRANPARAPVSTAGADPAALAARLPDPCFLIDRQGRVRYQNPVAKAQFGPIPEGRPLSLLLRVPDVGEAVQRASATGVAATVTYFERVPADRWYEAKVAPLGDDQGPDGLLMVLLRDLTEAQRVERMRVDFIANASHELRTPLASLTGFIETLQGSARNDAAARERFLGIMAEQARRMSRLIDDLLSLSRIELRAHVRPQGSVDLAALVRHVADTMLPLAGESAVSLELDVPDAPLFVRGDRDELAQVFQNLVHNALKYGHTGGRVDIAVGRRPRGAGRPDRISVCVRDYGPGIAAEHVPRLTERFYRVDAATSREKDGTGLGLAIVKHILNRHGGQLAIESEPGRGASFTVLLDAAKPDK